MVRVRRQDGLHLDLLQQSAVAVRDVDTAQILQHHAGDIVAVLGPDASGVGPQQQDRGVLSLRDTGKHPVDLCLDIQPVGLIQVIPPRQTGADLQHGEVVGEGLHLEPSGGNAGRSQGLRQRQLAVQIGSQEHQVRLGGEKRLQLRGLVGAHVGHILPQLQPPLIVGVLGHRCQRVLPSCQDPGLRVAADQGCHPLGRFLQGNGTAQAVREAHRAPHLPVRRRGGHRPSARSGAGAEGQQTECGDQGYGSFHHHLGFPFFSEAWVRSPRPNDRPHFTTRSPWMPQKSFLSTA